MNLPLVSIIIVNWNGVNLLKDSLRCLKKIDYSNKEILLVDNASSDSSVDFVKKYYPEIKIIQNKENFGFAKGNNIGYKHAKGEAIMILNSDTLFRKELLKELVKSLYSSKKIGAVQPKIVMYPDTKKIDSIGSFFSLSGILYHYGREKNPNNPKFNKEMKIYAAKGVCILFKKEVLKKSGFFDDDYFAYFEETDLCHRIWLAGYEIIYNPKIAVYHLGGASSSKIASSFIFFHAYKNRICTYIKNLSITYLLVVLTVTILIDFGITLIYFFTGQFKLAGAVLRAVWWNIIHIPQTLHKRSYIQNKIRKWPDKDFLPQISKEVRLSYYYYMLANHIFLGGMHKYEDK